MFYLLNYMLFLKSERGTFSKILFQVGLLMFETKNVNFMVILSKSISKSKWPLDQG